MVKSSHLSSLLCLRVTHLPCHPNLTDKTWYFNKRSKLFGGSTSMSSLISSEIVDILVTWPRITPGGLQRVKEDLNWWNPLWFSEQLRIRGAPESELNLPQWATKNKRCSWKWTEPTPVQGATEDLKCSRINFLRVQKEPISALNVVEPVCRVLHCTVTKSLTLNWKGGSIIAVSLFWFGQSSP